MKNSQNNHKNHQENDEKSHSPDDNHRFTTMATPFEKNYNEKDKKSSSFFIKKSHEK